MHRQHAARLASSVIAIGAHASFVESQVMERSGFLQISNPLPGPVGTNDDMEKFPGVRGAPSSFPGAVLSQPLRGFPMSMPGSLNAREPQGIDRNRIFPGSRIPLRPEIGREASGLGTSSTMESAVPLNPLEGPVDPAKAQSLKELNSRIMNLPETRLPESANLPARPPLTPTDVSGPIELLEVVQSVDRSYPPLLAIYEEYAIAEGGVISSVGGFDLDLNAAIRNYPLGYYQRWYHEYYLEQPTPYYGTKFFGGYRWGAGQYPIYYWPYRTQAGGEFAAGFEFPFLKNNKIDARRADLWKAELDRSNVDPKVLRERITFVNQASRSYWDWVAAGRKYQISEELLDKARERNVALARQVELGAMPEVELTDNQRIMIQRESLRLSSFRRFQQTTISLSLFYRDNFGLPAFPDSNRVPSTFPERVSPSLEQLPEDVELALRLRPEIRSISIQLEKAAIDMRLAENELLPGVNFYLYASQDVGAQPPTKNLKFLTLESSLLVDVPLQRRYAKGRVRTVRGEIAQLRQKYGFMRDSIVAEIQNVLSALSADYEQVELFQRSLQVNEALEESERRKYDLGNSNILLVNLREQATADAEALVVDAEAEYHRSWADYRAALALDAMNYDPKSKEGVRSMEMAVDSGYRNSQALRESARLRSEDAVPERLAPERLSVDSPLGGAASPFRPSQNAPVDNKPVSPLQPSLPSSVQPVPNR
jgi:outer membrane protein TolC